MQKRFTIMIIAHNMTESNVPIVKRLYEKTAITELLKKTNQQVQYYRDEKNLRNRSGKNRILTESKTTNIMLLLHYVDAKFLRK